MAVKVDRFPIPTHLWRDAQRNRRFTGHAKLLWTAVAKVLGKVAAGAELEEKNSEPAQIPRRYQRRDFAKRLFHGGTDEYEPDVLQHSLRAAEWAVPSFGFLDFHKVSPVALRSLLPEVAGDGACHRAEFDSGPPNFTEIPPTADRHAFPTIRSVEQSCSPGHDCRSDDREKGIAS